MTLEPWREAVCDCRFGGTCFVPALLADDGQLRPSDGVVRALAHRLFEQGLGTRRVFRHEDARQVQHRTQVGLPVLVALGSDEQGPLVGSHRRIPIAEARMGDADVVGVIPIARIELGGALVALERGLEVVELEGLLGGEGGLVGAVVADEQMGAELPGAGDAHADGEDHPRPAEPREARAAGPCGAAQRLSGDPGGSRFGPPALSAFCFRFLEFSVSLIFFQVPLPTSPLMPSPTGSNDGSAIFSFLGTSERIIEFGMLEKRDLNELQTNYSIARIFSLILSERRID